MRGTKLSDLRLALRAEIGQTMNTAAATQSDAALNALLSSKQKMIATMYDFPFLEERWDSNVGLGSHFVPMPVKTIDGDTASLDIERPVKAETFYNNYWMELDYGIGSMEYNHRNSYRQPTPEMDDPVQRWRYADDVPVPDTNQQIEIWPIPTTPQTIRITGQRTILPLKIDTDTCDLDDMLLIHLVAAQLLARQEYMDEAKMELQLANQRLLQLKATYPNREGRLVLGRNRGLSRRARRVVPLVLVAGPAGTQPTSPQQGGFLVLGGGGNIVQGGP